MSVVVIGLNHRTASLDLLERMAVAAADEPKALADLCARPNLSEAVVLSTCNRTEVYAVAERFHGGYQDVREFLAGHAGLAFDEFHDHLYVHYDEAAVAHLFSVAAGLDSAVLGETEILGQVADAWARALEAKAAGSTLNLLFRHALEVGKRARTETGISRGTTSVAHAAVAMATARLGSLAGRRVLVLGAGTMGEQLAAAVATSGPAQLTVCNRSAEAGAAVAAAVGAVAVPLAELDTHLASDDVVFTSTGAPSVLVTFDQVEAAARRRAGRPLLIVDSAMPRDVDPGAATIDGVSLLDMDDLREFVAVGIEGRRREAARVRRIVDEELDRFQDVAAARSASPLVAALRGRAEALRQAELDRFAGRLAALDDDERALVEAVTKGALAKLLHEPTLRLKDAAGTARGERLAEALRDLFAL